jgi:O-antigen/teichoic acid export membrane protein
LVGILPTTFVPLLILGARGPSEAAWYGTTALIAGVLNFLPSSMAQVLFAEVSRGAGIATHLAKAIRGVYALLLPAVVLVVALAPLILGVFGGEYARHASTCLRGLALAALCTGVNYLVDAVIIAAGRVGAYVAVNALNAGLVIVAVALALPYGLGAVAVGWCLAQLASTLVGLGLLRFMKIPLGRRAVRYVARHRPR